MENLTLVLIVLTNLLIVLVLGFFGYLIYRLIKQQNPAKEVKEATPELDSQKYHPAILERLKDAQRLKPKKGELFCPNHPDEPGETTCAICDRLFCRNCIKPFKTMHFCKEHMPLVMKNNWDEVLTLKTSTTDPEHGVRLYERKKDLFLSQEVPTYIETHYKIDVDHDHIETYLVLFGIREDLTEVKALFSDFIEPSEA